MFEYVDSLKKAEFGLDQIQEHKLYVYPFLIQLLKSIQRLYQVGQAPADIDTMIELVNDIYEDIKSRDSRSDELAELAELDGKCIELLARSYERKVTEQEFLDAIIALINEYYQLSIPTDDDIDNAAEEWIKSEDEQYVEYVPDDVRDLKLNLDGKPGTVDELLMATYIDTKSFGYSTPMADIFGDSYKIYRHNERVGLDQCAFTLQIETVNEEKLKKAKAQKKAMFNYISADDPDANFSALKLPGVKKKYGNMTLLISPYAKINIKKMNVNLSKDVRGGEKSDSVILRILVEPDEDHRILGNFRNYSYQEMLDKIYTAIDQAQELGIKFNREIIKLNYIELNSTFHIGRPFEEVEEPLKYFFSRLRKNSYTCAEYIKQDEKRFGKSNIRTLSVQGMQAHNESMSVKIYDKIYETKKSAMATLEGIADIVFDWNDLSFIRVEYSIKKKKILEDNFGTIDFLKLDDEKLQDVFIQLTEKYFKKPYEAYVKEAKEMLKEIVGRIVPRENKKWRIQLLKDIRDSQKLTQSTPIYLGDADVTYIVECNDIFYNNVNYYKPIIRELLAASDRFVLPGENSRYDILANFFAKTYYQQLLYDRRRLGYAVEYEEAENEI